MALTDMSDNNKDAIRELADQIKAGDDALNKLKVQNLDFYQLFEYTTGWLVNNL